MRKSREGERKGTGLGLHEVKTKLLPVQEGNEDVFQSLRSQEAVP